MSEIYWGCFIAGVLFTIVTFIFGDILGDFLEGVTEALIPGHPEFLQPVVIFGAITVFGGTGILLDRYSSLGATSVVLFSLLAAVSFSVPAYFLYARPLKDSENSTGFSVQDLVGKLGEVTVPVPSRGFGEVIIRIGAGNTNQIAISMDGEEIPAGTRVVVAEARDGVLSVFPFEESE
ncbi:MAG: protease [Bacillota bacterium]